MQCSSRSLSISGPRAAAAGENSTARKGVPSRAARLRSYTVLSCATLLLYGMSAPALAQQQTASLAGSGGSSLPEEPQPQLGTQSAKAQTLPEEGSASISGTVLDVSGAIVPGAKVVLMDSAGVQRRTLVSGSTGEFIFARVPPGSYLVVIDAAGLQHFESAVIVLTAQQSYQMPDVSLPIATATSEVTVRPTEVVAAEQIKAEEKQRVLGIIPNFYVSYVYDAAPLTRKQKYTLAFHDTFDPMRLVGSGIAAGIEQANNTYAGYGDGAAGYGKRFAARYGDGLTSDILSHALLPSLFHQDPRYFYQGSGSTKSRLIHAASFAVIARSDSGRPMPNYSYLLGDIGSGLLSNLYYPHADRGTGLVFTNAAIGIAGRAGGSIIREFLLKHVTTNVPGNGKP